VLRAYRDASAGLGEVLRKRRQIQASRTISPRELDPVLRRARSEPRPLGHRGIAAPE
jgi:hypothetical protein